MMEEGNVRDIESETCCPGQSAEPAYTRKASDPAGNRLSLRAVDLVDVQARNLSVSVNISTSVFSPYFATLTSRLWPTKGETLLKTILNDVSADMPSGSLTVIIGGSGSGKTSMLNVMARRIYGSSLHLSGCVAYNDKS
jgi:ABC-type glutathione transport system ATPase component